MLRHAHFYRLGWLIMLAICSALCQCATKVPCGGDGEGYEIHDQQVRFWIISDIPVGQDPNMIVKDADYRTFQSIDNLSPRCDKTFGSYGRDAVHVFYRGVIINEADPETFEIIASQYYNDFAKDKNAVYFRGKFVTNRVQEFRIRSDYWYATEGKDGYHLHKLP